MCVYTHIHTYTLEYYSVIKKNEIIPFAATWMDPEITIFKWSKSDRERQIPYDITYMWNLKHDISELVCETKVETNRHGKQTYGYLRGKGVDEG